MSGNTIAATAIASVHTFRSDDPSDGFHFQLRLMFPTAFGVLVGGESDTLKGFVEKDTEKDTAGRFLC